MNLLMKFFVAIYYFSLIPVRIGMFCWGYRSVGSDVCYLQYNTLFHISQTMKSPQSLSLLKRIAYRNRLP